MSILETLCLVRRFGYNRLWLRTKLYKPFSITTIFKTVQERRSVKSLIFEPWFIAPLSAIASILVGLYFYRYVDRQESGTERMKEIASAIKEGASAFLNREYKTLAVFAAVVATIILVFLPLPLWLNPDPMRNGEMAIAYAFGAFCSALAGFLGLSIATKANTKGANAAREGLNKAFPIGFRGGAVMGMAVVGLGLLGISAIYWMTSDPIVVLGYSFGASSLALFAKAGGGIYTKTADISADLVGKVELGIPEDDPRNPAVIADNVGDNVGDVAGMGADLFDSYVASIVAVMILGTTLDIAAGSSDLLFTKIPLVFAGIGVVSAILGALTVRVGKQGNPGKALNMGTYVTCLFFMVLTYVVSAYLQYDLTIWGSAAVGLVAGVIIGKTSDYFTSDDKAPVLNTAKSSETGTATNIITGFSYGLLSVFPPLIGIGVAAAIAFYLHGLFGIGIAAVGMLSIVGLIVSNDAYGPIVDNSRGIAEQAGLGEDVIRITDELDSAGNTAKAISKGFAIGAAGLTVIALLAAFQETSVKVLKDIFPNDPSKWIVNFSLMDPLVLLGTLVGIAMPAVFSAMVMLGVGRNAERMIAEIRRQFKDIPGLKEGKPGVKPDYAKCVTLRLKEPCANYCRQVL